MTFTSTKAKQLLFTEVLDTDVDEEMVAEMYWSMVQRHPLFIIDQAAGNNIYGEPSGDPELGPIQPSYAASDPVELPMHIKLDPEEELLNKYGYDRVRDAVVWMSSKILRDLSLNPKVGDRIHFTYVDAAGSTILEQLEIHEASPFDFVRQAKVPYQVTYACDRTHKEKQP